MTTRMSVAVTRVVAISLSLVAFSQPSLAIARDLPEDPTDLVRELEEKLRACEYEERDDLFVEIEDYSLGPDGKPLIPILMEMLSDTTPRRRASSFGPGGPGRELSAQEIRDEDAKAILDLLTTFGREGVEPLRRALKSNDASTRSYAACGLGMIGVNAEDTASHLFHTLKDDDARARRNAVWALQQIGRQSERSIKAIADVLEDDDPQVVVQACESLRQYGQDARVALPQLVATANRYERMYRAAKLPKDDERHMASLLATALLEPEPALALPRLMRVLRSQDSYLTYVSDRPVSADTSRSRNAQELAAHRLAQFGQDSASAAPSLVELARAFELASGFGDQSVHAFDVLVEIGKPAHELIRLRLLPLLEQDLESKTASARLDAANRILRVFPQHQRALDEVVAALQYEGPLRTGGLGPSSDRRTTAAEIAVRVSSHDRRLMPALKELLNGPPTPFKLQAARTIGILEPKSSNWRGAMIECLHDYYKHRRGSDATTWKSMGDNSPAIADAYKLLGEDAQPFYPEYVGILPSFTQGGGMFGAVTRDPKNMQRVVELGAAIVPTLIEAVEAKLPEDEWYNYNYMASEALGLIGKDAAPAVPALCKILRESKQPGLREDAAVALGRIGTNAELAVPALTSALDDGWAKVRAAAAEALATFGKGAKPALKRLR